MTIQRDVYQQALRGIQSELLQVLDGMDYCLDWKPAPQDWSAREIIYHLLDTPPCGLPECCLGFFLEQCKNTICGLT